MAQVAVTVTPSSRPGNSSDDEGRPLPEVGLRHFAATIWPGARKFPRAGLSSPRGEIVLTSRLLLHSLFLALAVVVLGCSKSDGTHGPCPRPEPAFRLEITAEKGRLPEDTFLRVFYSGKPDTDPDPRVPAHEDYDVRHPAENVDVCCRTGTPVTGKLPSVPCSRPPVADASTKSDAALVTEAGLDGAHRDAAPETSDAATDAGVTTDSGASTGAPDALLCDLWTNGWADIVLTGSTYPKLKKSLDVQVDDECGVVRRDVRIIWTRHDGGQ